MASNVLAKLGVIISAITKDFDKSLQNSSKQLNNFSNISAAASKALAAFGVGFGIYEVARGVKQAIGIMADFEKTMSEVMAITGATGEEFEKLRNDALRLGASTKYTATQVGQLQIAYGRLGFTTKEILKATEATLDLAAATGEDLAKSADVAGSTIRGFGLDAKETQRVVDVMASSFNKSALGLENFAESMKYVAPVANAAGASVEETTALLATLADAGIRGSMAGTSLRKIFTDIAKDGRPLGERLKELGDKGITMADAFDEVGRTAQTSLLILAKNTDKTKELTHAFQNASGEAAKMARVMSDNLAGDVTKLSSAWEGLILNLSKSDVLRDITQSLTGLFSAFASGGKNQAEGILKRLASDLKNWGTLGQPTLDNIAAMLGEIRREVGKPFDAIGITEQLAEAYKLTDEAASQLYQTILKANEALSFQEKTIKHFNDFAKLNGYKDLTLAAEDYKRKIYALILAEEIKKRQFENSASFADGAYDENIKGINEEISGYRRIIRIIAEYQQDFVKSEEEVAAVQQVTIKNLEYYREKLKEVNEEYDKTAQLTDELGIKDASRLRVLSQEIQGLENKIKLLEMIRKHGGDDFSITGAPKSSSLTAGMDEALTKRLAEQMEALRLRTKNTTKEIKENYIDMSSSIGSALTGIADAMGQAIAGTGDFGKNILKVLASFARQVGETLIGLGTAMLAAKIMLKNPYTAIAAGIALVALSGALSASLSKAQSNFNGGGSGSIASTATQNSSSRSMTTAQDSSPELVAVIRGQDIWVMLQNYERNNKKTKSGG